MTWVTRQVRRDGFPPSKGNLSRNMFAFYGSNPFGYRNLNAFTFSRSIIRRLTKTDDEEANPD